MSISRSGGSKWFFYNIPKSSFYNGLTFQEARVIAKILTPDERNYWLVWKEGWSQWRKMSFAGELLVTTSTVLRLMEPPPIPDGLLKVDIEDTKTKTKSEVFMIDDTSDEASVIIAKAKPVPEEIRSQVEDLEVEEESLADEGPLPNNMTLPENFVLRKDQRVSVDIPVEIVSQGRKFSTKTIDLSVSGVQVTDALPNWLAGYCTIILRRPDINKPLEFVCSVVENQEPTQRRRLEIHPTTDTIHLKRWLLDFYIQSKRTEAS